MSCSSCASDAFSAVMERDLSFFDTNPSGRIVSRVTSDSDDFSNVVTLTMNLVSQILLVAIIVAVLFTRNVTLALVAVSITPVFVVLALAFRPHRARFDPEGAAVQPESSTPASRRR